ncbi:hypothetical protein WN48_04965 [Eufriesea mexicana]|nr:hypothetical protein WN48_04965 [Eufriesea mexicana]
MDAPKRHVFPRYFVPTTPTDPRGPASGHPEGETDRRARNGGWFANGPVVVVVESWVEKSAVYERWIRSIETRFDAVARFRNEWPMPIVTQLKGGHTAPRNTSLRCWKDGERETKGRAEVLVIKAFRQTYIAETGYPGIGAFRSCIPAGGCLQDRNLRKVERRREQEPGFEELSPGTKRATWFQTGLLWNISRSTWFSGTGGVNPGEKSRLVQRAGSIELTRDLVVGRPSVLYDARHLITASGKRERETGEPEGDREAKRGKMGARQSRRSVDITTTPKKEGLPAEGGVGDAAAPGDGKLERIEETDTKPTTNGIAPHTDVAEDKDKDKDDATEKEKDKEKVILDHLSCIFRLKRLENGGVTSNFIEGLLKNPLSMVSMIQAFSIIQNKKTQRHSC